MVTQFKNDYGVNACLVNLGSLHGPGISSTISGIEDGIGSSDGIIRFIDDAAPVRLTSLDAAIRAVFFVLENGSAFTGTLHTIAKHAPAARISVLAADLSLARLQSRRHFIFQEKEESHRFNAYF